jgi:hypothetical protein
LPEILFRPEASLEFHLFYTTGGRRLIRPNRFARRSTSATISTESEGVGTEGDKDGKER